MSAPILLNPEEQGLFLRLTDPEHSPPASLASERIPNLLHAAEFHGVLPVVLRKISASANGQSLLDRCAAYPALARQFEVGIALTMMLEHYCALIQDALFTQRLRAVIVKGIVFARSLYPHANDRPFTDIDLLVHPADIDNVARILAGMQFSRFRKNFWDRSDSYQEQKWFLDGNSNIMIELHGNLVHYPSLRRGVSFGYAEYCVARQSESDCPVASFFTAIVHASLGHKFHKLQLLVDVLQAWRKMSPDERACVGEVSRALSLQLETGLCLTLIADLFDEPSAREFSGHFALGAQSRWARKLVSPAVVLQTANSGGRHSRLRRHAFRWLQSLHLGR